MRRALIAAFAFFGLAGAALGQHRREGAIDWSPDGSWYPNVRTHTELRMPTQSEANHAYARFLAQGGDPMRLGVDRANVPEQLQLFACRPGYFDRYRGETWAHQGWVTCHVFFSATAEMRPSSKTTLNWRWTGRQFEPEGTPALAVAYAVRRTAPRTIKP
ncbi:MAG: hypothetical protein ACRCTI_20245 [Beijerinckiaceae bacterium]